MIETLIYVFGPQLAEKFFGNRNKLTLEDVAQGIVDVGQEAHKHESAIEEIRKELKGLSPMNVNPQLNAINEWMERHVKTEQETINIIQRKIEKLANQQLYWNIALTCGLVMLSIVIFRIFTK